MKKKLASLLFCVMLLVQLAAPTAQAAEKVYFVAAGESVVPLTDATMPFWSNGYLYIACTIFTGRTWESLDISNVQNLQQGIAVLYSTTKAMAFDLNKGYGQDSDGNTYTPGAIRKGNVIFVPASLVAGFFGLEYSVTETSMGYLAWLRYPNFGLTPTQFADAAIFSMMIRYDEYTGAQSGGDTSGGNAPGEDDNSAATGKKIYLAAEANDGTGALLATLERTGARATFFCSETFLRNNGGLLRRMTANGQAVGLLADAAADTPVTDQLALGNALLDAATCTKTRIVMLQNASAADTAAAEAAGYYCFTPRLNRAGYSLKSTENASALIQAVSAQRGEKVTVWLGGNVGASGLSAVLSAAKRDGVTCNALRETVS